LGRNKRINATNATFNSRYYVRQRSRPVLKIISLHVLLSELLVLKMQAWF